MTTETLEKIKQIPGMLMTQQEESVIQILCEEIDGLKKEIVILKDRLIASYIMNRPS